MLINLENPRHEVYRTNSLKTNTILHSLSWSKFHTHKEAYTQACIQSHKLLHPDRLVGLHQLDELSFTAEDSCGISQPGNIHFVSSNEYCDRSAPASCRLLKNTAQVSNSGINKELTKKKRNNNQAPKALNYNPVINRDAIYIYIYIHIKIKQINTYFLSNSPTFVANA